MSSEHLEKLNKKDSHEKGCVTKHETDYKPGNRCSYRGNGYDEMSKGRARLYELDFTQEENAARLPSLYKQYKPGVKKSASTFFMAVDPREEKDAWWFKGSNFKHSWLPYNHNYHHIMPETSLKELTYEELDVLQHAGYNVNGRKNMIILPTLNAYGVAMLLPSHPGGHRKYNRAVKQKIADIKQTVKRNSAHHEINEDNVKNFRTDLIQWQKRQFRVLVDYGKSLANEDPAKPMRNQVNKSPVAATGSPK